MELLLRLQKSKFLYNCLTLFMILWGSNNDVYAQSTKFSMNKGHKSYISSIFMTPDNKNIISYASWDDEIIIWDVAKTKKVESFGSIKGLLKSDIITSCNDMLLDPGSGYTNILWNRVINDSVNELAEKYPKEDFICFAPNRKYTVTILEDKLQLWNVSEQSVIATLPGKFGNLATFSPDSKNLIISGNDKIMMVGIPNLSENRILLADFNNIDYIKYSPDGRYIIASAYSDSMIIYDNQMEKTYTICGEVNYKSPIFSYNNEFIYYGVEIVGNRDSVQNKIKRYNFIDKKPDSEFCIPTEIPENLCLTGDNEFLFSGGGYMLGFETAINEIALWSLDSRHDDIFIDPPETSTIISAGLCNDGQYFYSVSNGNIIKLFDIYSIERNLTFKLFPKGMPSSDEFQEKPLYAPQSERYNLFKYLNGQEIKTLHKWWDFNPVLYIFKDGEKVYSQFQEYQNWNKINCWMNNKDCNEKEYIIHPDIVKTMDLSGDEKYALSGCWEGELNLWDIYKKSKIKKFKGHDDCIEDIAFSSSGEFAVSIDSDDKMNIWDIRNLKSKPIRTLDACGLSVDISPDDNYILSTSCDDSDDIILWDFKTGDRLKVFQGHNDDVTSVKFLNSEMAISGSYDHSIKFWDIKSGKEIATLLAVDSTDWIIITPDNYYMCTKGILNSVGFKIGSRSFNFRQFDLKFNRPDIVLSRLGYADDEMINSYKEIYKTRLEAYGVSEEVFNDSYNTPVVKILNKESFEIISDKKIIHLLIEAVDSISTLSSIDILVNGVPYLMGARKNVQSNYYLDTIKVELSKGKNNIKVLARNRATAESIPDNLDITFNTNNLPNLYFIGIGASDYHSLDKLMGVENDIYESVKLFNTRKGILFNDIIVDTILNQRVSRENIQLLNKKLSETNVDDYVVVFYSGHGVLHNNTDLILSSYNFSLTNPDSLGIPYTDLENLLDDIPARNKLLIINACHSGERGDTLKSYYKMKRIFSDLRVGNGSHIIASSESGQSSLAADSNNSFSRFGLYFIRALKNEQGMDNNFADTNSDKELSINEVILFITKQISLSTFYDQTPTIRQENVENNFRLF